MEGYVSFFMSSLVALLEEVEKTDPSFRYFLLNKIYILKWYSHL